MLHSAVGYGGRDQIIMQFGNYFDGLNSTGHLILRDGAISHN